jgi:bifunctional DNA-binding transcriptional regulator/antitoxin component of YhaV-PrlF toxin-antitoxin module
MPHFETRMGADGKLVVPEDVQTAFKLKRGDVSDFYLDETARTARLRARNLDFSTIGEMFPVGQAPSRPMSIKDMDDAIGEHLEEDDERIKRGAKEWAALDSLAGQG